MPFIFHLLETKTIFRDLYGSFIYQNLRQICNLISLALSFIFSYFLAICGCQVALTHGPENVKPKVKQTDESGNICFEVCWHKSPSILHSLLFLALLLLLYDHLKKACLLTSVCLFVR